MMYILYIFIYLEHFISYLKFLKCLVYQKVNIIFKMDEFPIVVGEVDNVKVVVRCRPITDGEVQNGHTTAVQVNCIMKSISVINPISKNVSYGTFF